MDCPAVRRKPPEAWTPPTYAEIGEALGLTRQRVHQIEREALRKCRAWCEARGLDLSDLLEDLLVR